MEDNVKNEVYKHIIGLIYIDKLAVNKELNILNISFDISEISNQIKETAKNTNVFNLEIDKNPDETINKTLEFLYEEKYFDYVIITEVLEGLIDPWQVLKKIKKYLKPDGAIISSVTNVMYCKVVHSIIGGTFTYLSEGEPQMNMIRNFTLLQAQKLFDYNGFKIDTTLSVKTKEVEKYKNLIDNLCKMTNEGLREQYNSYNYIIKASINPKKTLEDYVLNN